MTEYERDVDDHPVMCSHRNAGVTYVNGLVRCERCFTPVAMYRRAWTPFGGTAMIVTPFDRDMGDESPQEREDVPLDESDAAWLGFVKFMRDRGHWTTAGEDMIHEEG